MTSRRQVLALGAGLLAQSGPVLATPTDRNPILALSGALHGRVNRITGIGIDLSPRYSIEVSGRVHGFARRPGHSNSVAFARRPGTFALVFDHQSGEVMHQIDCVSGRHFYGHGVYSLDGRTLYATENDYASGDGVVGVYDATDSYIRVGEFASGGIGPHEICRVPDSDRLLVANGGVRTHPDTGRAPLNEETMRSTVCELSGSNGQLTDQLSIDGWAKLSIRHLAIGQKGVAVLGMQHRGPPNERPPLVAIWRPGEPVQPVELPEADRAACDNYIGSVTVSTNGKRAVASAPRGGRFFNIDLASRTVTTLTMADGCGVLATTRGLLFSGGGGDLLADSSRASYPAIRWDNHLG